MQHLHTASSRYGSNVNPSVAPTTSPGFDALVSRVGMPFEFLVKVLDAGWLTDPREVGAHQRSVLLGYLGTFDNPVPYSSGQAPDLGLSVAFNNRQHVQGAHRRDVDLALRLLDLGADPWLKDLDGRDSLDQTFSLQWWPLFDRLWSDPARPAADVLQQRTLDVNYVNSPVSQHRPMALPWLHAAVALGRETMVETLLDGGFDVNRTDAHGRTALFYAVRASTVELLVRHGADVATVDSFGRHVELHWSTPRKQDGAMDLRSEDLAAMKGVIRPLLDAQAKASPELATQQNQRVLFELAATGTKDNLVKHLRATGTSVNDTTEVDGRPVSLLAHACLACLKDRKNKRSTASAQHLLERVDDPWHASGAGVPDVVLAWLAACRDKADNRLVAVSENVLNERYGWDQPGGFERFLDEFLPMADRLIAWQARTTDDDDVNLLAVAVASAELRMARELHPKVALPAALDRWHLQRDAQGHNYAWRWAAVAASGALGDITPATANLIENNLEHWASGKSLGQSFYGDARYAEPKAPVDSMALHAMLAHFCHRPQPGEGIPKLYGASLLANAFVNTLHRGARLDTSLPGFESRMEGIRARRPAVAQDLETRILRDEARLNTPRNAPKAPPRARL